jgi:hypothetical protein
LLSDNVSSVPQKKMNITMRPSTTRFLSGIVMVAFLGCGVVGAEAGSGPDAGVGISGKLDYDHPANGSGPAITRRHYNDGLRHRAAELASDFNFSPTRGEIASAFAAVSRMDAAICSPRATSVSSVRCKFSAIDGE